MTTALVPMGELQKMAQVIVSSKLFGVETVEQAMTLMLLAQSENVHPMIALRDYHIVEGKPALKADAMLARFQAGGGKVEWQEYTDTKVSAYFSHPASPKPVLIEWSLESAGKVSVYNRKKSTWEPIISRHTWKSYPRQMLKARVISEGVRATNPGVAVGIYTVEETQDFTEPRQEKNITPSAGVEEQLTQDEIEQVAYVVDKMRGHLASGDIAGAVDAMTATTMNAEQQIYTWNHFDSKQRSAMKREQARLRVVSAAPAATVVTSTLVVAPEATPPTSSDNVARSHVQTLTIETISDAAKKRLEARISETKLDREQVKQYILLAFGKQHFAELTKEEYRIVDGFVEIMATTTTEALHAFWNTLSKDDRITLTAAKDRKKAELEAKEAV